VASKLWNRPSHLPARRVRKRSLGLILSLSLLSLAAPPPAHAAVRTCLGEPATIIGTNGKDVLRGTPQTDVIVGLHGVDTLLGRGGDDLLCSGPGGHLAGRHGDIERSETVRGGAGSDILLASRGIDVLFGGDGKDILIGRFRYDEEGSTSLLGGDGADRLMVKLSNSGAGGRGNDRILAQGGFASGGQGIDVIIGSKRSESMDGDGALYNIRGHGGRDDISGGSGNDLIHGSEGSDFLSGGSGNDRIYGGRDRDQFFGDRGTNLLHGGPEVDRVHVIFCCRPAVIDFSQGSLIQGEHSSRVVSIENATGSDKDDTFIGGARSNSFNGESGRDVMRGRGGGDVLLGSWSSDLIDGGKGDDRLSGGAKNQAIGGDDDVLKGRRGDDRLSGGWGADTLEGDEGSDRLYGGLHDDALDGGGGANINNGGDGLDGCIRPDPAEGALNCEFVLEDVVSHTGLWFLYSERADKSYKRLIKTIDLTSVVATNNPKLTFWVVDRDRTRMGLRVRRGTQPQPEQLDNTSG
jgi:Ca2+-binding RTX toxin-like protein